MCYENKFRQVIKRRLGIVPRLRVPSFAEKLSKECYGVDEVLEILGESEKNLTKLIRSGALPSFIYQNNTMVRRVVLINVLHQKLYRFKYGLTQDIYFDQCM